MSNQGFPEARLSGTPFSARRGQTRIRREEHAMRSGTKDQAEGRFHKMKGKVKEIAGKVGGDSGLEAEGRDERLAGKVQEKIGQVKKVLGKG